MRLCGFVVCVDYTDLLERSIDRWHIGLDRLIVVTSSRDQRTIAMCRRHNVETYQTDIFYANGAVFNKGAALSEAVLATGLRDGNHWLVMFDADTVPPPTWRDEIEQAGLTKGNLYGAYRYFLPESSQDLRVNGQRPMPQSWVIGFFMVFHAMDHTLPSGPIFELCWPHAGNYDTIFCRRWPRSHWVFLGLKMIHLGDERQNWMGRGERQKLRDLLAKRRRHEDWESERMANPPVLTINGRMYS